MQRHDGKKTSSTSRGRCFGGLWVAVALSLAACSNEQIYDSIQGNAQLECSKLPQDQYEQCMAEYSQTYEDYAREREALLEDNAKTGD
ncbi:MAG: hypothetical protein AAGA91_14825 [Pseudomonadota bacterium]